MRDPAISSRHPAVIFTYFASVIALTMCSLHPLRVAISLAGAMVCAVYILGARKALLTSAIGLVPAIITAAVNPLVNTMGLTVLFYIGRICVTREAVIYGVCSGGMLLSILLWFACCSRILTADKFLSLFGGVAPTTALVLSQIMRAIPDTLRRAEEVRCAQQAMLGGGISRRDRIRRGGRMASILMSWGMENSIETADSMRARGYGSGVRTKYIHERLGRRDTLLLTALIAVAACNIAALIFCGRFDFYPFMSRISLPAWAWAAYILLTAFPLILEAKEYVMCLR